MPTLPLLLATALPALAETAPAAPAPVVMELHTSREDGIDAAALSAAILDKQAELDACHAGKAEGGRFTLNIDWTKKEQHLKLRSYTSGMEETAACAQALLEAVTWREVEGAKKAGQASVELVFTAG